jgi:hypothetical protein
MTKPIETAGKPEPCSSLDPWKPLATPADGKRPAGVPGRPTSRAFPRPLIAEAYARLDGAGSSFAMRNAPPSDGSLTSALAEQLFSVGRFLRAITFCMEKQFLHGRLAISAEEMRELTFLTGIYKSVLSALSNRDVGGSVESTAIQQIVNLDLDSLRKMYENSKEPAPLVDP